MPASFKIRRIRPVGKGRKVDSEHKSQELPLACVVLNQSLHFAQHGTLIRSSGPAIYLPAREPPWTAKEQMRKISTSS